MSYEYYISLFKDCYYYENDSVLAFDSLHLLSLCSNVVFLCFRVSMYFFTLCSFVALTKNTDVMTYLVEVTDQQLVALVCVNGQVRRKGKSPMTSRKWRDVTEGVGQTSRMAALTRSPLTKKRHRIANSSTVTAQAAASSDEDADQTTTVSDVGQYHTESHHVILKV